MDYKSIISEVLNNLGKPFEFTDDPNDEIDGVLKNEEINWYPPYLVILEDKFFMFLPFSAEDFIYEPEIKELCKNAELLMDCLKKEGRSSKVFFITNVNEDVKALEQQDLSNDFGILHNELEKPFLDFSIEDIFKVTCRLLPNILEYLSSCKNLKGEIGKLIKQFSKRYLKEKPKGDSENEMIKKFLKKILTCDKRFSLDSNPINFMAEIDNIVIKYTANRIREHYFHAFNTMMLGFMIIDKFYDRFEILAKRYGDDIVLEFIWILTSLYHDIGYPVLFQQSLLSQTFGLERENNLVLINDCIKQNRQEFWKSPDYSFIITVLNNLFYHIKDNKGGRWVFDGFSRRDKSTKFKSSMKISFVEEGAHGVASTLILALVTNKHIKEVESNKDREFLYRHIMLASISILFHDSKVRDCFRKSSIKKIKAEDFPFSALLTYVDILQDDRRDPTGSSSRPDIFREVNNINERIIAKLKEEVLVEGIKKKLFGELEEALSFFIMNDLSFGIPEELSTIEV